MDCFIGIDLGGTNIKVVTISEEGQVISKTTGPTDVHRPPQAVVETMAGMARRVMNEARERGYEARAVGTGIPGLIDWDAGVCIMLPNFPGKWEGVRLKSLLEAALGLPVYVINDARATTLAEKRLGAGKSVDSLVLATVGTGIGGGVVVNGDLYLGADGGAGEVGHIIVEPGGILCGCGNRGCLEAYASGPAMVAMAIRAIVQQNDTLIRDLVEGDLNKVTPKVIAEAAGKGDRVAIDVIEKAAEYIGIALSSAATTINPQMIVIGGGVAQAGERLINKIREVIHARVHIVPGEKIQVVPAELGPDAGMIGAALWAKERLGR
ncbi:MAG TPA: ROK family protein [Firmicutes bacterium]|nr:ROK family protein [Bacillota bacterium]